MSDEALRAENDRLKAHVRAIESSMEHHVATATVKLQRRIAALVAALEEIQQGKGPFSLDHKQHAINTVEAMKALAADALADARAEMPYPVRCQRTDGGSECVAQQYAKHIDQFADLHIKAQKRLDEAEALLREGNSLSRGPGSVDMMAKDLSWRSRVINFLGERGAVDWAKARMLREHVMPALQWMLAYIEDNQDADWFTTQHVTHELRSLLVSEERREQAGKWYRARMMANAERINEGGPDDV